MARQRGILEEVLIPLNWRLAHIERHFPNSANTSQLFLKTKGDVERIKSFFQFAEKLEAEAISRFEEVYQFVDDLLIIEEIRPLLVDSHVVMIPESTSATRAGKEIIEEAAETTESTSATRAGKEIIIEEAAETTESTSATRAGKEIIEEAAENILKHINAVIHQLSTSLKESGAALREPADDSQQSQPLVEPDEREESLSQITESEAEEMSYRILPGFEWISHKHEICLLLLSAIPENKFIEKTLLIHWWIGEGLFATEEDAEICLGELIYLHLIHPIYSPWNSKKVVQCRSVHRLKILKSLLWKDFFWPSRRACLSHTAAKTDCDWKELVSVYNISSQYLTLEADWFKGNNRLIVMQLGRWQDDPEHYVHVKSSDFLQCLSWCTELRYLSLRGILGITELPDSIANLTNLIILDLRACQRLEKLPAAITSLRRLTHLDVSECYLLDHIPSGIECLLELQVLKGFVIGDPRSKDKCGLRDLAKLLKLRKLSIVILQEACLSEGEFYGLEDLIALRSLTFRWAVASASNPKKTRQLFAPPNLEKLVLQCVPVHGLEDWMSTETLGKLKKLYIWGVDLASLGNGMTMVEVLRLKCLKNLRIDWTDQQDAKFPNLSCIQLYKCPGITSTQRRIPSAQEGGLGIKRNDEFQFPWITSTQEGKTSAQVLWIKSNGSWSHKSI